MNRRRLLQTLAAVPLVALVGKAPKALAKYASATSKPMTMIPGDTLTVPKTWEVEVKQPEHWDLLIDGPTNLPVQGTSHGLGANPWLHGIDADGVKLYIRGRMYSAIVHFDVPRAMTIRGIIWAPWPQAASGEIVTWSETWQYN